MTDCQEIINLLLENDEEDDLVSWKDVTSINHWMDDANEWMVLTLPRFGFEKFEQGGGRWEKQKGHLLVNVSHSTKEDCVLMTRFELTQGGRWQNQEMLSVPFGNEAIAQLVKWGIIRTR